MAAAAGGAAGGRADDGRRAGHDGRRRRAAARPRQRHRQPAVPGGHLDRRPVRGRHGGARLAALGGAPVHAGTALVAVRREHWTLHRWLAVTGAIVAFYVTYLAYRNLKSMVPLLRPGDLFDGAAGRRRPRALPRPRSGRAAARRGRHRARHARLLGHLHAVLPLHPGHARRRARVLAQPQHRPLLRHRAVAELAARAPRATSCCRRWGRSTPTRARSPRSRAPTPASCRRSCSSSGPSSCATRRWDRRRASARSPPCTSRSS